MLGSPGVFLDRDGVLNEVRMVGTTASGPPTVSGPRTVGELSIVPGAADQVSRLRAAGFRTLVVSNQPDIARGELTVAAVEAVNEALRRGLAVDAVYYCPHDRADGCPCRKPRPGLILTAAAEWDVDTDRSCLVGDRWVDILAAQRAGVDAILLERGWSWQATSAGVPPPGLQPLHRAATLAACVDFILGSARYRGQG